MNIGGYAGKELRIKLNSKSIVKQKLNYEILRKYLGGVGYGAKVLYDELGANINAMDSDNKLIFATGPLTGRSIPGGGSVLVCFKSPLTNLWGESRCGGEFGPNLKSAGYDFLIIEEKSETPVYIFICEDRIEIRDASNLKGKTVSEKTNIIREWEEDTKLTVMCIGPAGENGVLYSTIMCEGRAAGRCGAGAVMGSKNLLAIAVKGSKVTEIADPERFKKSVKNARKVIRDNAGTETFRKHGTTKDIVACDDVGDWPTKNWHSNSWGKGEELYNHFFEHNLVKNSDCYGGCPIACGRIIKVDNGKLKTPIHEGGEYESISAFTAFIMNENMDAAVHSTYLCNEYGIDTISMGAAIAFMMECYEKGVVSLDDVDGLDLYWGNSEILSTLIKKVSERDGIGNLLADGVMRASEKLGDTAKEFAIHGKGLEAPAHDPRAGKALAVAYGTANRGMCHIHPLEATSYDLGKKDFGLMPYGVADPNEIDRWDEEGKGKQVKILQDGCVIPDILSNCKFMIYRGLNIDHYAEMVSSLTGWEITGEELLKIGERTINIQRLFNVREGCSSTDDVIPARMKILPVFGAYAKEERCAITNYEDMLKDYYLMRGWDKNGVPTKDKLKELEL